MDIELGLRVVRGPDWKWGDQDGGEGTVGSVVEVSTADVPPNGTSLVRGVVVQWDTGNRSNYRCGVEGKYDLRVFDSGPTGMKHVNIICDSCRQNGIFGMRWKCVKCYDFDLCTPCYNDGKHTLEHEFCRIDVVQGPSLHIPPRITSKRMVAKGVFPGAEIARGHDWLWGDQDGGLGKAGTVTDVKGVPSPQNETQRSAVEVEWKETKKRNIYRIGHKGKVDLKCVEPGDGGYYYPDHLPTLGAPCEPTPVPPSPDSHKIKSGDQVRVQLELEIFKMMQEGHGGWNDQMIEAMEEVGTVQTILDSGDVRVRFPSNKTWTLNSDAIAKVTEREGPKVPRSEIPQTTQLTSGNVVKIIDDIATLHNLQEGHGGWVDDMALSLGQVGRVIKVFPTGDVRVAVNGRTWTYNPRCMVPAPGETAPELMAQEFESEDIDLHLKLLSLLENPAVIVAAAASGDENTIRDFLKKHPKEVNAKAAGRAAIHCAAMAGNVAVLKVLLEFGGNLEVEDEDGDKALHLCAYSDEDEFAKLLIDGGANVNSKNNKGATPLIIAAVKGHVSVLRVLANNHTIRLHEQDSDGDTALHCAVLAQKNESVGILLNAGADPTLLNFRLFTPIHEAARIGFLPAVEHFIRRFPQHLSLTKDDGYTPLHLAALNDHLDVVTVLADTEACNLDAKTNGEQTALHLAIHQGHSRIVERLVGYGSDLSVQDCDGDTPLHLALMRETVDTLSPDTPQLKKVREVFGIEGDSPTHASATIACFLVQEGADMYTYNKKGHTPLQICAPDVASLVTTFTRREGPGFHKSLRTPSAPVGAHSSTIRASHLPPVGISVGAASPQLLTSAAASTTTGPTVGQEVCFLCEAPVDVKFEPCGHALMCSQCAERARKCPTCKKPVKTISKLIETCSMCKDDQATVTLRPCGHKYCAECARRMKVCFECKAVIQLKEGLPPDPTSPPPATQGSAQPCAICLTEPRNTAFLCGHQLCWECAQRVDHCPVCRKFVTHRIRLFQ